MSGVKVVLECLGGVVLGLFDASKNLAPRVPHHTFEINEPADPEDFVKELEAKGPK